MLYPQSIAAVLLIVVVSTSAQKNADCWLKELEWSACEGACGIGRQRRELMILAQPIGAGKACPADLVEYRQCDTGRSCSQDLKDCVVRYSDWSECDATCDNGRQLRWLAILQDPVGNGRPCPTELEEIRECYAGVPCRQPLDCKIQWNAWSACSASCGSGTQSRSATITQYPRHGGRPCPSTLLESRSCNRGVCSVDCQFTYSEWSQCDVTCGQGKQHRRLQIQTHAVGNGRRCPTELSETRICDSRRICNPPVDCLVQWNAWSRCSVSCGAGTESRHATVITQPQFGGRLCPALTERRSCDLGSCPVDCQIEWQSWSECDVSCGAGRQTRRAVIVQPPNGGRECPAASNMEQHRLCNSGNCPVDCQFEWLSWSRCDAACGPGHQTRRAVIVTPGANGGKQCPQLLQESKPCDSGPCAVDCQIQWHFWSPCDVSCGEGRQVRRATIVKEASLGGRVCPSEAELVETQSCNARPCPINCEVRWQPWSNCGAECGAGVQTRRALVVTEPKHGGRSCPHGEEIRPCYSTPCPINCKIDWQAWSRCDAVCGEGNQFRHAMVSTAPAHGGESCPADLVQIRRCQSGPCKVDCQVQWHFWTRCDATCGNGRQLRRATIVTPAANGGRPCPTQLQETRSCNAGVCPAHCQVRWGPWEQCNAKCGPGVQSRKATILSPSAHGGRACPALLSESRPCDAGPCPIDCRMEWESWSQCDAACGNGVQTRRAIVVTEALHGGHACSTSGSERVETRSCNAGACPVDCQIQWHYWSRCSATCGAGTQTRRATVVTPPSNGGRPCPTVLREVRSCHAGQCPLHCKVQWQPWSQCDVTCGAGEQTRRASVLVNPSNGGEACPALFEKRQCAVGACPVDCAVDWDRWSRCSASCGPGIQTRHSRIVRPASSGGKSCPSLREEVQPCNLGPCPQDCQIQWLSWSSCSVSCGVGRQSRRATVVSPAQHRGLPCPDVLEESRSCNAGPCSADCVVEWGPWSGCDAQCGPGSQQRWASVVSAPVNGGRPCPQLAESRPCDAGICSVDCRTKVSEWGECSATCGAGTQKRWTMIVAEAQGNGRPCPDRDSLVEERICNTRLCNTPVDCVMGWSAWSACSNRCGAGTQSRTRRVITRAEHGGRSCPLPPFDTESRTCKAFEDCPNEGGIQHAYDAL